MKCLTTDKEGLTAYLRFPAEHHHRARHSNFIERTFGETRRRTKVSDRLPGETSCLTLVWAVLDRASRGWRGVNIDPDGLRLLQDLRRSLLQPPPSSGHTPSPPASPPTAPKLSADEWSSFPVRTYLQARPAQRRSSSPAARTRSTRALTSPRKNARPFASANTMT